MEENDKRKIDIKENKWENQNYIKTIGRDTEVKEDGEKERRETLRQRTLGCYT